MSVTMDAPRTITNVALNVGTLPNGAHYVQVSGPDERDVETVFNYLRSRGRMQSFDNGVESGHSRDGATMRWVFARGEDAEAVGQVCAEMLDVRLLPIC